MIISSCPLRISLFGGSTDNPFFIKKYGYGSVISFTCDLKTYATISQDKFGFNKDQHKYIINYSAREEVSNIQEIKNDVVRVVLEYFNMPPIHITLFSDAYSQGSGLASSSSYLISLIKSCCLFLNKHITDIEICELAFKLEQKINPYCGYQDAYGCGIGGFKKIDFEKCNTVKYEFLTTELFEKYDFDLVFTGITRNSKNILKNIPENIDKSLPLLKTAEDAYNVLKIKDYKQFLHLLNISWQQKKTTSALITENPHIKNIDKTFLEDQNIIAHKLCGAGNGGFFLIISNPNSLKTSYGSIKIKMASNGVTGNIL
jgi:D-glycero-alpha-D-manno-heptose-7-phosphate kinase